MFPCSCGRAVVWLCFLPQQDQTLHSPGLLVYLEQLVVFLSLSCFHIPFQFHASHYVRAILFCEFMQTVYAQCHEGLCYG